MHLRVHSRHSFSIHNNEKNNNNYSKRMIHCRDNTLLRHRVVTMAKRINGNVRINNNDKHNHSAMSKARRLIIRCASSSNYNDDDDNNDNNDDNDNVDDVSYDKLRQVEAQAAALRLELERRKRMNDNNGSSNSNDTDDANDESGSSKKRKKKRRMSYTQIQSSQANSISDLIGYVNRGARGVSELELLDSSSSSSSSSSDGIDSDSNLRRNIITSLILTLSFSLLSQIRLPVYSLKGTLKGNRELYLYLITAVRLTEQLEGLKQVTMRLTIIILMVIMEHNSNSIVFTIITINY